MQAEIRRLILWFPVGLGCGIWAYFELEREPDPLWALIVAGPALLMVSGMARRAGLAGVVLTVACLSVTLGFAAAIGHAHRLNAPILGYPAYETVEGRVIGISRSASGAARLLLDRVTVHGLTAAETPLRIRVTLREGDRLPPPGARAMVYARLSPPAGPSEPGGFDFRRRAYFEQIGAVGYALGVLVPVPSEARGSIPDRLALWVTSRRLAMAEYFRATVPGSAGAFIAAIIVGDRFGIDEADAEALRISNLAHLLAISGLHMGIMTGMVFVTARMLLAGIPALALRYPTKKIAALAAILAGAAYLALSGTTIATQRAFIMVTVALAAVLIDRPAISLRALAVSATLILLIRPVSLLDVGFQMSFGATTALVAGYSALRDFRRRREMPERGYVKPSRLAALGRVALTYCGGLVMTSLLAGVATAPYSAFHFNRAGIYGLPANLAAVPVMGAWVAPCALLAAGLAPLGLAEPALQLMAVGIDWILLVAHEIAALPGAISPVPEAPGWVLPAISLGGLFLAIWCGAWRLFGLLPIAVALAGWSWGSTRPELLISSDGRLVGLMAAEGRALDQSRAAGFVAGRWLLRDGDLAPQAEAFARPGLDVSKGLTLATLSNGAQIAVLKPGKAAEKAAGRVCATADTVLNFSKSKLPHPCHVIGLRDLRRMGALAIHARGDGLRIEASIGTGDRLWSNRK